MKFVLRVRVSAYERIYKQMGTPRPLYNKNHRVCGPSFLLPMVHSFYFLAEKLGNFPRSKPETLLSSKNVLEKTNDGRGEVLGGC